MALNGEKINVVYNILSQKIRAELNNKLAYLSGKIGEKGLSGALFIPKISQNVEFLLSIDSNSVIKASCRSRFAGGMSFNFSYDFSKLSLNDLSVGKMLSFSNFSVENSGKIQDTVIAKLPKGKIIVKGIKLKADEFTLGDWKVENIDIATLQKQGTEKVNGIVNGHGYFKNNAEYFFLAVKNITYGRWKIPPLSINGIYGKDMFNAQVVYKAQGKENVVSVKAKTKDWVINKDSNINVKADGITSIEEIFKNDRVKGRVQYNFLVSGTLRNPIYEGKIHVKNGTYVHNSIGTYLKGGEISAFVKNKEIIIDKIYMSDDKRKIGTITGTGKITLKNKEPIIDAVLKATSLAVAEMNGLRGSISGKLNLHGNITKEIKVTGEGRAVNSSFDISNLIKMSNYSLGIAESLRPIPKASPVKIPIKVPLDIKLNIPNCDIKGYGVISSWSGGATFGGDLFGETLYSGSVKMRNGTIKVAGKKFTLENGTISMSDKTKKAVIVDVSAVKILENIKVGARFTQDTNKNEVTFFSTPYASKNDILSYMLFEKQSSEISTGEALKLLSAMSSITSGTKDSNIIDKVKSVFFLDTIEFNTHKDSDKQYNSVKIGKNIGNLKISIDQGTGKDSTKVVVDTKVFKDTKVSVDVAGNNNVGAGIFWSKRY
ncbi:MAG: translocation/assembly module TamB domain-containing protein [Holosporales bacterium]|jgi:hypothetical protein|nr:translocation/assembly module TamB domain-containing protein [Holosporales bacterium]